MNAGTTINTHLQSDPFDGTIMPILYIPDWSKTQYQNKTTTFADIPISEYIPLPKYDPITLLDISNTSSKSLILHYTYITPYMGSYRMNSIANGVVIRTVEADATGNRFVVVRHDGVTLNGKKQSLYSWYLHLSEITVQEWTKVRKWDMIGRVGMSGIATTPHLHIQIDTEDAPFHPYWPFTSADSRSAGLSFFDSIDAGLGKESAMRYNINPMSFINSFLNWVTTANSSTNMASAPIKTEEIHELIPVNASVESIIASMSISSKTNIVEKPIVSNISQSSTKPCEKKRFSDMSSSSKVGKILYNLIDSRCMFQGISAFSPNSTITQKDAIMLLMELLTKEDFVELLVKVGKLERNPSQIKIFKDTNAMNLKFQYIQDYAFKIRARGGNFYPQTLLTRQWAIEILGNILTRDQAKK